MTIKNLNKLKRLAPVFTECNGAALGLYEDGKGIHLIIENRPMYAYGGELVGYNEIEVFSSIEKFTLHLENKIGEVFGIYDDNFSGLMTSYALLQDYIYAPYHTLIKHVCLTSNRMSHIKSIDKHDYFGTWQGTDDGLKEFKVLCNDYKVESITSVIELILSIYNKLEDYNSSIIVESGEYSIEDIPNLIDRLTVKEQNLLALMCMLDIKPGFNFNVSRYSFIKRFGVLDKEVLSSIGLNEVDEYFESYYIHREYFLLSVREKTPLFIYTKNGCLLSEVNELWAWRSFSSIMKEMNDTAYVMFEPEDRG